MSFNYSYFEAPSSKGEWWSSRDSNKTVIEPGSNGYTNPDFIPITTNNVEEQMVTANNNQNLYINPSTMDCEEQSMLSQNLYTPLQHISPDINLVNTPSCGASKAWLAGVSCGYNLIASNCNNTEQSEHEVIYGTVTQLFSNFGYIDDSIIFSISDIVGPMVKVGDKVVIDSNFESNNPSKYKGIEVCKIGFKSASSSYLNNTKSVTEQSALNVLYSKNKDKSIQDSRRATTNNNAVNKENLACAKTIRNSSSDKLKSKKQSSTSKISFNIKSKTTDLKHVSKDILNRSPDLRPSSKEVKEKSSDRRTSKEVKENSNDSRISSKEKSTDLRNSSSDIVEKLTDLRHSSKETREKLTDLKHSSRDAKEKSTNLKHSSRDAREKSTDLKRSSRNTREKSTDLKRSSRDAREKSTDLRNSSRETKIKPNDVKNKSTDLLHSPRDAKEISADSKRNSPEDTDKSQTKDIKVAKSKDSKSSQSKNNVESVIPKHMVPFKIQKITKSESQKRSVDSPSKHVSKCFDSFAFREIDCAILKNQFRTVPLPPQLFHISLKFQESFPLNHPLKLGNSCNFKIMDKKIIPINKFIDEELNKNIDPVDADTTFVVKVMLLSTDDLNKFYKHTLTLAEDYTSDIKIPITKAIKFLVASMGENKEFGIGGAWSPSLDGHDPISNSRVLINTAIRTCRSMTGIDLSECSLWQKFLELRYYRPLQKLHKNNNDEFENVSMEWSEPRMETVVYFIPDVWNIVPSKDSWNEIKLCYQEQLACYMCPPPACCQGPPKDHKAHEAGRRATNSANTTIIPAQVEPTHYSKLTPSTMKIADIKRELELRKLNSRGVMDQLKTRLKAILEREENEEKQKVPEPVSAPTIIQGPTISDAEKNEIKKLYTLPDSPHIIIHQNLNYKDLKIRTMSLHSLLSYYDVELEENTFELAVFAKQFIEMLKRDAVFNIYKSIVTASEDDLMTKDDSAKRAKVSATTTKRTINKSLLFSCTLLDREKSNKILLEDLKTLIEGLGICLSSRQLSNVLDKVKDNSKYFRYRQLTDKIMTQSEVNTFLNKEVNEDLDYMNELARGNKALFDDHEIIVDHVINKTEVDRLRNNLEKSERARQSLQLIIEEIKRGRESKDDVSQTQSNEIEKLRSQGSEYQRQYYNEKHRADAYKRDFERLFEQLKDIDKMSIEVKHLVCNTMEKFTKTCEEEQTPANVSYKIKLKRTKLKRSKKSKREKIKHYLKKDIEDKKSRYRQIRKTISKISADDQAIEGATDVSMSNDENLTTDMTMKEITPEVEADSISEYSEVVLSEVVVPEVVVPEVVVSEVVVPEVVVSEHLCTA